MVKRRLYMADLGVQFSNEVPDRIRRVSKIKKRLKQGVETLAIHISSWMMHHVKLCIRSISNCYVEIGIAWLPYTEPAGFWMFTQKLSK